NPVRWVLEPVATFLPQVGALGLTKEDIESASKVAGLGGDVNRRPDLAPGCVGVSVSKDDDISSGLADCVVASLSPRRPVTVDLLKPQLPPEFFGHPPPSQAMRARRVDPRCEDLHVVTALVGFPSPATEGRPGGKALGTEAHHNLPMSGSRAHVLDLAESVDLSHRESGTHLSEDRDDALQEVILIRIRSSNADTGAQPQGGTLLPVADEHRIAREHRRDNSGLTPHVRSSSILRTTLREVVAVSALGQDELLVHVGVQTESGRLVLQAEPHSSDALVKRVSDRDAGGIHGLKVRRVQDAHQVASAGTRNHLGVEALGDTVDQPVVKEGAQLTG